MHCDGSVELPIPDRSRGWQSGPSKASFNSGSEVARQIGLDVSLGARPLRLTLLAPDMVEMVLAPVMNRTGCRCRR